MSKNSNKIRLLISVAGHRFAHSRGDVLTIGDDIDAKEAALWVAGGRAEVHEESKQNKPETATAEPDMETADRPRPRRRRRGSASKEKT